MLGQFLKKVFFQNLFVVIWNFKTDRFFNCQFLEAPARLKRVRNPESGKVLILWHSYFNLVKLSNGSSLQNFIPYNKFKNLTKVKIKFSVQN